MGTEPQLEQFAEYRRTHDRAIRNALVRDHHWIAVHCARRFAHRGEPMDDLMQVAQLGLLKAVERFDPSYRVVFATFAMPTVTGELRRHFRDHTWPVRVPRRVKELYLELSACIELLGHELGRPRAGRRDRRSDADLDRRGARGDGGRRRLPQHLARPVVGRVTTTPTGSEGAVVGGGRRRAGRRRHARVGSRAGQRVAGARAQGRVSAVLQGLHPIGDRRRGRRQPGPHLADPSRHAASTRPAGVGRPPESAIDFSGNAAPWSCRSHAVSGTSPTTSRASAARERSGFGTWTRRRRSR